MKGLLMTLTLVLLLAVPVGAVEIQPPPAPESAREYMPQRAESFGEGLWQILTDAIGRFRPDLKEASGVCLGVMAVAMLTGTVSRLPGMGQKTTVLVGTVASAVLLLGTTHSLVGLAASTIEELSQYGKLLLPVMAAAMGAQGQLTSAAALYTGTAMFSWVLSSLIHALLVPMVYLYLVSSVLGNAVEEPLLQKGKDFIKWLTVWSLKIILYVFTGYMSITGVVSGTTDAAALKATKLTISGMVPVVGGILSDASEAVLVSAGLAKNAAGIYGILALISIFLGPFLRIGAHYLMIKITGGICEMFGPKGVTSLVGDVTSAMGMLLAMTGSVCLLFLISTVCFLRGVG